MSNSTPIPNPTPISNPTPIPNLISILIPIPKKDDDAGFNS